MTPALHRRVADEAAAAYRAAGPFARHFARGKLRHDPVFALLLEQRLIPDGARLLDLGCGQGLLAAWLAAAGRVFERGAWPPEWPRPPAPLGYAGVERRPAEVRRARLCLGPEAVILSGDVLDAVWPAADVIVLLDLLHYLDAAAQDALLRRARRALPARGRLLLRVGDATGGVRQRWSGAIDRVVAAARGDGWGRLHGRSAAAWETLLAERGFTAEAVPLRPVGSLANRFYLARPRLKEHP